MRDRLRPKSSSKLIQLCLETPIGKALPFLRDPSLMHDRSAHVPLDLDSLVPLALVSLVLVLLLSLALDDSRSC